MYFRKLTSSEERFLLLAQRYPNTGAFNEHCGFEIEGELDISILHQSVSMVCARHEALRSHVVTKFAKAMIRVLPTVTVDLSIDDVSAMDGKEITRQVKRFAQYAFNISEPPLFRLKLFKLQPKRWLLAMIMHHIISDGDPSFTIFAKEVSACYEAMFVSQTPNLEPCTSPCFEYNFEQKQEKLKFWSKSLKGSANFINLPWQQNPLKLHTFDSETITITVPAEVTKGLIKLSHAEKITHGIEPILLSMYVLMLHKYSGQMEIPVGYPVFNRSKQNRNLNQIGYFGNPLVIYTELDNQHTFVDLVKRVSQNIVLAIQNDYPFQHVVEEVNADWHKYSRTPLFNALFVYCKGTGETLTGEQFKISLTQIDLGLVPYDLILTVRHSCDESLMCSLQYNSKALHQKVMSSFLQCFSSVCRAVPENPKHCISSFPMLFGEEITNQIKELNENVNSSYSKKCIHEIFEECTMLHSNNIAIHEVGGRGIELTYEQLSVASNHIASILHQDVQPTDSIGLMMERSANAVASILGILKAGCCYVPIDTQSTEKRLEVYLRECNIKYILCSKEYEGVIASVMARNCLIKHVIGECDMFPAEIHVKVCIHTPSVSADSVAYTMLTSGTTGQPKAVDVPHRAIVRIACEANYIQFTKEDVSFLHSPLNFDASTFELWSALLNGGRLEVSVEERLSPTELAKQVYHSGITMIWLTSGLFNVLMDLHIQMFCKVKHILTGGDVVSTEKVQLAQGKLPNSLFYNMYGPTEATTFTTFYKVPENFKQTSLAQVPIGVPISHTRVYILDSNLMPVPTGMCGTLYIGGIGVARGYRNVESNAFIAPLFYIKSIFPDEGKLYDTGDTVRILPDPLKGNELVLHFIGRHDRQVKVSGVRLDLTEIEHAILKHPAVRNASVVVHKERADTKHLAAYVVLNKDLKMRDLQTHLKQILPAYMTPTSLFAIDSIPLNNNGKVHQSQLQEIKASSSRFHLIQSSSSRKPQSDCEKMIASIWASELGISEDDITMQFDFFENGGHSLIAQRMISRLSEELGTDIEITSIYYHPVFEDFAKEVHFNKDENKTPELISNPTGLDLHPLTFQQKEFAMLQQIGKYSPANNVFAALIMHEMIDENLYEQTVNKVIQRHDVLHSLFHDTKDTTEVIRCPVLGALHVSVTTVKEENTVNDIIPSINSYIAMEFDYYRGPLVRFKLYKFSNKTIIVLVCHHIIADDITAWLVLKETVSQFEPGQTEDAYKLYALQQKSRVNTLQYISDISYWKDKLKKIIFLPNFTLHSNEHLFGKSANVSLSINFLSVSSLCTKFNASPVEVVLAALFMAVYNVTGSDELYIASPFANRNNKKTAKLIGLLANRVVLHLKQPNEVLTIETLLLMIRKEITETLQHQNVPLNVQFPLLGYSFVTLSSEIIPDGGEPLWTDYSNIPADQLIFLDIKSTGKEIRGFLHYKQGYFLHDYMLHLAENITNSIETFTKDTTDLSLSKASTTPVLHTDHKFKRFFYNGILIDLSMVENTIQEDDSVQDCFVTYYMENGTPRIYIYIQASKQRNVDEERLIKLSRNLPPCTITQLSSLPRNKQGFVDENKLCKVPTIDYTLQQKILSVVKKYYPEIRATISREHKSMSQTLNLTKHTDILPTEKNASHLNQDKNSSHVSKSPREISKSDHNDISDPLSYSASKENPLTMVEALQRTVSKYPDKGITFFEEMQQINFLSYTDLYEAALHYQIRLKIQGLTKGCFVILLISKPRHLVPMWWGCALHGIVPTIVAKAVSYKEYSGTAEKLYHVWTTLNHACIITDEAPEDIKQLAVFCPDFRNAQVIALSSLQCIPISDEHHPTVVLPSPDDLLFLQLSSGSTGAPKCIQELHNRVIAHILSSSKANNYSSEDNTLNWIPMDHVVPILTFHLKDTYLGCNQHMVETSLVLSDPLVWLKIISEFKITHTWSPNFGYALAAKALATSDSKETNLISLSSIKSMINAGEMVTPDTIRSFLNMTAPFGLNESAVQPSFGMAETATCFTYHNAVGLNSDAWVYQYEGYEFVSLGPPMQGVSIRITDEFGIELNDGLIGELEIKGSVVTPGYLFNKKASDELFRNGWMRSGDHAFIKDKNLFITGRIKEQIVLRGIKYFCHEIEERVNDIVGVTPTYSAAFGVTNTEKGTEELVILFTPISPDLPKYELQNTVKRICLNISRFFGVVPSHTAAITKLQFQKTTSGKIQRVAMKKKFIEGAYILQTISSSAQLAKSFTVPIHSVIWEPVSLNIVKNNRKVLVFMHTEDCRIFDQLSNSLKDETCLLISVSHSTNKLALSTSVGWHCTIQTIPEHNAYCDVWQKLQGECGFVDAVVNLISYGVCESNANLTSPWLDKQNHQLLHLVQSLKHVPPNKTKIKVLNVTSQSAHVIKTDTVCPTKSLASSLISVASKEFEGHFTLQQIDVPITTDSKEIHFLSNAIIKEVYTTMKEPQVAYRNFQRFVPRVKEVDLLESTKQNQLISGGVYVISGGAGGIACHLSLYLHKSTNARLILIGRRPQSNTAVQECLATLDKNSVHYTYIEGDICSDAIFEDILTASNGQRICGAFHLATFYEEKPIQSLTMKDYQIAMEPKVKGAFNLHKFLSQNSENSFLELFSSVYSIIPAKGLATYSAANKFLEMFHHYCSTQQTSNVQTGCISWPVWKNTGISQGHAINELGDMYSIDVIEAETAVQLLEPSVKQSYPVHIGMQNGGSMHVSHETAVKSGILQDTCVIVVDEDSVGKNFNTNVLTEMLMQDSLFDMHGNKWDTSRVIIKLIKNSKLVEEDKANYVEVYSKILNCWKGILCIPEATQVVSDNLYEMGGDSIQIAQFTSTLNKAFDTSLSLQDIMEHPSLTTLASLISGLKSEAKANNNLMPPPSKTTDVSQIQWHNTRDDYHRKNIAIDCHLFCLPYIGMPNNIFKEWLFPGISVWTTNYPLTPCSMKELVKALAQELIRIVQVIPAPFAILGYSFGALLSVDIYCYLCEHKMPLPCSLLICGMSSPRQVSERNLSSAGLQLLSDIEDDSKFLSELKKIGFKIQPEILSSMTEFHSTITQIRYLYALYEKYECTLDLKINCPVEVLGGKDDQTIVQDELKNWESVTSVSPRIMLFSGDHFFIEESGNKVFAKVIENLMSVSQIKMCDTIQS